MTWEAISLILLAYLLGSLCTAIGVAKAMKLADPRTQGSGNPGATNMLRVGGKKAAAITLVGDALKAMPPLLLGHLLSLPPITMMAIAVAAVLGHLFPLFFQFRGGKGVATAIGASLVLSWPVGLAVVVTWLMMAKVVRISSLSALVAWIAAPLYSWWLSPDYVWGFSIIAALVIISHHQNIRQLLAGTEA